MQNITRRQFHRGFFIALFVAVFGLARPLFAADAYVPFAGDKTTWHGFDRYDFLMDDQTQAVKPHTVVEDQKNGIRGVVPGQRRCVVIVPKEVAPGAPWSWRGCYWDHQPQTEIELLKQGFHVAYITADAELKPDKMWDTWYAFLTEKHGLSAKPAFIGMSRGGEYEYTWATAHPDKVACIYADNPGSNHEVFTRLMDLARMDVPVLHVCGSIDPLLAKNSLAIESIYQQFGGRVSMMIKEGAGHHPHSLHEAKPIVDFILQSVGDKRDPPPTFVPKKFLRNSFYSDDSFYRDFPTEGMHITCRGPLFVACYDRYAFDLPGVQGTITVIAPKAAAPGMPWVFRADGVGRDGAVDLALLAKGFHVVTGPVPYDGEGPLLPAWNAVYEYLTAKGFGKKPVLEGAGGATGDAYAWAIQNPENVACIYGENPILRSRMSKTPVLDGLATLAKAGVPLLHVCGGLDPGLDDNTKAAEKRYKELGGSLTVILQEGLGHTPSAPKDPKPIVDFIVQKTQ